VVGRDGLLDHDDKVRGQVGAERATELVERAPHLAGDDSTARSVGDDHLDGNAAARAQQRLPTRARGADDRRGSGGNPVEGAGEWGSTF